MIKGSGDMNYQIIYILFIIFLHMHCYYLSLRRNCQHSWMLISFFSASEVAEEVCYYAPNNLSIQMVAVMHLTILLNYPYTILQENLGPVSI